VPDRSISCIHLSVDGDRWLGRWVEIGGTSSGARANGRYRIHSEQPAERVRHGMV